MLDFPSAPSSGQVYTLGARSWRWNGSAWDKVINEGQGASVFTQVVAVESYAGPFASGQVAFAFNLVNYV